MWDSNIINSFIQLNKKTKIVWKLFLEKKYKYIYI